VSGTKRDQIASARKRAERRARITALPGEPEPEKPRVTKKRKRGRHDA